MRDAPITDNVSPDPVAGKGSRRVHVAFLAGTSLLVAALVFCLFTPRMAIWRGLHVPEAQFHPEINRASVALQQVDDPFLQNTELGLTNLGLAWRLFFPVVAHYLNFSDGLYLALPHIGCLMTLALVAHLAWRETGRRWLAFLITVITGALPWFFVSTGWLSYVDSWWILGLLVVGLVPSRAALFTACLLTPWIDERFVIALPLAIVVRAIYVYQPNDDNLRAWLRDAALAVAPVLPYIAIRLFAMLGQDATADHFTREWQRIEDATPFRFLEGLWSGYRVAWIFVLAFVPLAWQRRPHITEFLVIPGLLLTSAAAIGIAADMSRGLTMLVPVMLAGCLLLYRARPRLGTIAICVTAIANLLLPACHALWYFETPIPIGNLYTEMQRLENPPPEVNSAHHMAVGLRHSDLGETDKAFYYLNNAVRLSGTNADARVYRGLLHLRQGNVDAARQDIDTAVRLAPDSPDAHYAQGVLRLKLGNRTTAAEALQRAITVGGRDWNRRAECQQLLNSLSEN